MTLAVTNNTFHIQRPELLTIETTITYAQKKLKLAQDKAKEVEKEKKEKESKLPSLRKEFEAVETSLKRLQEEQQKVSEENGFNLDEDDIKLYSKLYVSYHLHLPPQV